MSISESIDPVLIHWGSEDCSPGHEYGGVRNYFLLHIITRGEGEYQCGGRRWPLEKGDAFLIFPGQKHMYRADSQRPWSYFWLGFQGDFDKIFTALKLERTSPILHYDSVAELQQIFEGIPEPRIYKHPAEHLENQGRFNLILGKLLRQRKALQPPALQSDSGHSHHVLSMETYINDYFNTPIQVQDIIDFVQLERSYASRIFKETMGRSIGATLRELRLSKACIYLEEGCSAKETAYSCGYRDYNNFLKAFKKRMGKTPAEFKKDVTSDSMQGSMESELTYE